MESERVRLEKKKRELNAKITLAKQDSDFYIEKVNKEISNVKNVINMRCQNVCFCTGGAYNALLANANNAENASTSAKGAYDRINMDDIEEHGSIKVLLSQNKSQCDFYFCKLKQLNEIKVIINKMK